MQETQTLFSQNLYEKHLSSVNNIYFTIREIDVVACLVNARRTSKIAYFLSINPRTVETHIRNIMSKLKCNTREDIIDFMETSDKAYFLRKYYTLLQVEAIFKKSLKTISKLNRERDLRCFFMVEKNKDPLVVRLKSHLSLAGITVSSAARKKEGDYVIVILPKALKEEEVSLFLQKTTQNSNKPLFLLQERKNYKEIPKELIDFDIVDFAKHENYYFSFFTLLQRVLPNLKLDEVISNFKDDYKKTHTEPNLLQALSNEEPAKNIFISRSILFIFLVIGLIIISGFLAFRWNQTKNEDNTIRSDLIVPKESALLNRPELINQIDEMLKEQDDIQTIAIVGPGGSGKTTLARQYARQQKSSSTWEINAETRRSLNTSFENLGLALAKTQLDQKLLRVIQETTDVTEKENRLIQFVKERLKSKSNWFLIYDNVEKFTDIQKHFPQDSDTWGQGKIILTTRDANIGNNEHVNHMLPIGELNSHQKLTLFTKAMRGEDTFPFTETQIAEEKKFLEKIPPFPLDVTIAAYYLKATNVSYAAYLKNILHSNNEFVKMQEILLKEVGEYTKTRYDIITLSLQKVAEEREDFRSLLLLVSLLDSQNITRDLLTKFKNDLVVDNVIFNLKKYSLLTNESAISSISPLSIHRSTQETTLEYFIRTLGIEKTKKLVGEITELLDHYINAVVEDENVIKMKFLMSHCEAFLNHKQLLTPHIEGVIKGNLGIIYYFYGDHIKAKTLFEESLLKLNKHYGENPTRIAMFMGYLGNVFRDLGDYDKGKDLLKESLSIYDKYYPRDFLKHAYFLAYLGIIERYMGNYDEAKNLFEKGVVIYKKHFPENENYQAWVYGQMGIVNRELGNYETSKEILEKSLASFKTHRSATHFDIAWALEHLGVVYTKLGHYEKAKDTLEQCLKIYALYFSDEIGSSWVLAHFEPFDSSEKHEKIKKLFNQVIENNKYHFHENYIYVAWPLRQLGNLYVEIGNYEKAKILLEQTLAIYEKNYGSDHLEVARTLNDLGQAYFLAGDLKTSEDLMGRALRIFEHYKHPESYACLENLSDLFMKKSNLAESKGDITKSQDFKTQAVSFLNQALETTKVHFPKDSSFTQKIEGKLKTF